MIFFEQVFEMQVKLRLVRIHQERWVRFENGGMTEDDISFFLGVQSLIEQGYTLESSIKISRRKEEAKIQKGN